MTATTTESKPEDKTKAEKVTVGSAPSWTWGLLVAICLILITIGLVSSCNEKKKTEEARAKEAAAEYAATHPAPVATIPQQHIPTPTFHAFGPDGCYETALGYEARWSPKDKAMRVYDPGGGSHVETLGKKSPISAFGPGTWRFCKEDPAATGVVIWE